MEYEEAKEAVVGLIRDQGDDELLRGEIDARMEARANLIDAFLAMYPQLTHPAGPRRELLAEIEAAEAGVPRGKRAVLEVLQSRPGSFWTIDYIELELRDRGWLPEAEDPKPAIRAALQRLTDDPESRVEKRNITSMGIAARVAWVYVPEFPGWMDYEPDDETREQMRADAESGRYDDYEPDEDDLERMRDAAAAVEEYLISRREVDP